MSDQGRWWKFYTTAPTDPHIQALDRGDRWSWAALGAYIKVHGEKGVLNSPIINPVMAAFLGVTPDELILTIKRIVNVCTNIVFEEGKNRHGEFTVTWQKWVSFQEDTTMAKRQQTSRTKRRGEERRREETRGEEKKLNTFVPCVDSATPWTGTLDDVRRFLVDIQAPNVFFNEAYWLRIDQWLGSSSQVAYFDELKAYLAWHTAQNGHAKHKDLLRGFRNWLSTCSRWKERDAAKRAVYARHTGS